MYANSQNTVAYYKSRPFLTCMRFADAPAAPLLEQALKEVQSGKKECIGESANDFYLLNHAFSLIVAGNAPAAPLSAEQGQLAELYLRRAGHIGRRMFLDLVGLLCTQASISTPDAFHIDSVADAYGAGAGEIALAASQNPSGLNQWMPGDKKSVAKTIAAIMEAAERHDATVDQAISSLTDIVDWNKRKLAYGPLWRDVGGAALAFSRGNKPLEVIADNLFSYCHCSGSFFEKGALFSPVGARLFELLDVQRSGQVPQLCNQGFGLSGSAAAKEALALGRKCFPEVFCAKLDRSIVKHVTQNELTFHNKYKQSWNAAVAGGAGWAQNPPPKPVPKIFNPFEDPDALNNILGI